MLPLIRTGKALVVLLDPIRLEHHTIAGLNEGVGQSQRLDRLGNKVADGTVRVVFVLTPKSRNQRGGHVILSVQHEFECYQRWPADSALFVGVIHSRFAGTILILLLFQLPFNDRKITGRVWVMPRMLQTQGTYQPGFGCSIVSNLNKMPALVGQHVVVIRVAL